MHSRKPGSQINDDFNTLGWIKCISLVSDENKNIEFSVFNAVVYSGYFFFMLTSLT